MPSNVSVVAAETESPKMAGDVIDPEAGKYLHFDWIYDQPVLCPCGLCATETIVDLKDGDVVSINKIPWSICEKLGVPREVKAEHVGGLNNPGFRVRQCSGSYGVVISYRDLYEAEKDEPVEFYVEKICD